MIQRERPYALSIAGLDPSAGAGLLADVKTFETCRVYGLGVCTALTVQHDSRFDSVDWVAFPQIQAQSALLLERYPVSVIKIGLIESYEVLDRLVSWLAANWPAITLIWDPILKASAGFAFHDGTPAHSLDALSLITPNMPESIQLSGHSDAREGALMLSTHCPVYLKGGHAGGEVFITDRLYQKGTETAHYTSPFLPSGEKHGSGCVVSSAIAAGLALGRSLPEACAFAKEYTGQFLGSTPTLLGFHS
ncbi:hydroxymethylpyrimidine/phosphomethylpyrimidine kinase [Siphonobacter aquaeclarae]|uniref:hydroxymethylpyrimidine kinase n=1 Tax=Siphonobacter aquaeclarae TaxID=563176 RepID=A0A1G9SSE1_9BACT|nr:hydroxymethylpyrimidine/phosphomethylpyrimidine kinase [Siphonobacter aquaeclarae]SDM38368.1 hydroxymethylpyrimidine/phosphomethylpyrimidine kinase [Siphonobacter aquaeclarae]